MIQYPYNSAILLDDPTFLLYGGDIGTSTPPQRAIAYLLAEEQMTYHLNSFLQPTTVTGTYFWKSGNPLNLEYGNLRIVHQVIIQSLSANMTIELSSGCHAVRGDGKYGYVDIQGMVNCSGCNGLLTYPYNIQVAFESGLPTGTSMSPSIMTALVLAAQVNLNEMDVSLSNEGTADIGIKSFMNQKYSEVRAKLGNTLFGNSAVSQRIARLVSRYRTKPSIGFH